MRLFFGKVIWFFSNPAEIPINDALPALRAADPTSSSKILYYITINNPSDWYVDVQGVTLGYWSNIQESSMVAEGVFYDWMKYDNGLKVRGNSITLTKITLKK